MQKIFVLSIFVVSFNACQTNHKASIARLTSEKALFRDVQAICQQYKMPAMAAAVFSDKSIKSIALSGLRANNAPQKVTVDDLFHLGTASQVLTSFWAALLVESGQINWETTIIEVFPAWKDHVLKVYQGLSLSDLLSHRSKLPAFNSDKDIAKLPNFEGSPSDKRWAFAKWLLRQNPIKPQNESDFSFSKSGYAIAAAMLEKRSQNSWETAIQKDIALPLSLFIQLGWPTAYNKRQPHGHYARNPLDSNLRAVTQDNMFYLDDIFAPADNLSMSIGNFAQYLQLHLQGLRGQDNYLSSKTYHQLHRSNAKNSNGWTQLIQNNKLISTIDGTNGTFYTQVVLYPDQNLGLLIFVNAANLNATKAVYSLRKKILTSYLSK